MSPTVRGQRIAATCLALPGSPVTTETLIRQAMPERDPVDMARRIAGRPAFALRLAKESVNQTLEAQGQLTALKAAFSIQHLAHAHNRVRFGIPVDPGGLT